MAFSNPLTFANIVSAGNFQLVDPTGVVVAEWQCLNSNLGSIFGPATVGNGGNISWSGDGNIDSVSIASGAPGGDGAGVDASYSIAGNSVVDLTAYDAGNLVAGLTLTAPAGTAALTASTGITYNTRSVSFVQATAEAASTANLALGAADVAIPGCSITHSLNTGDVVVITGTFDLGNAGATSTAWGSLYVNGAQYAGGRGPGHTIGAGGRSTVSHSWRYVAASAGSYTFVLRARQSAGTWTAYQPFGAGGTVISTVLYCTT